MGSPDSEAGHQPDETRHRVRVSRPFYISIHEITRRQWTTVMPVEPIGISAGGQDSPVVNVSWFEVSNFVDRMNRLGREAFRLPTEAEWEYACRSGSDTPYSTGETLSADQANYGGRFPLPGQPRDRRAADSPASGPSPPTRGGFSTCMATPGNGRRTRIARMAAIPRILTRRATGR